MKIYAKLKSKKILIRAVFLLFIVCTIIITAVIFTKCASDNRGNTVGNIINMGLMARQGDWIFYSGGSSGLYKTRTDGSGMIMLDDDEGWRDFVNVAGDWVYYKMSSGALNRSIYKIRTDGTGKTKIADDDAWYINVVDDWIYYISATREGWIPYKIDIDGNGRTEFSVEAGCSYLNVVGGWIYYGGMNNFGVTGIYKMRTDGSNWTKISDDHGVHINVVDDWVYYANTGDDWKLYRIKTDGSGKTKLNDDYNSGINVSGDWVFYTNWSEDEGNRLYKIKTDGSGRKELDGDIINDSISVLGNFVYYYSRKNDIDLWELYKIRADGTRRQIVD